MSIEKITQALNDDSKDVGGIALCSDINVPYGCVALRTLDKYKATFRVPADFILEGYLAVGTYLAEQIEFLRRRKKFETKIISIHPDFYATVHNGLAQFGGKVITTYKEPTAEDLRGEYIEDTSKLE